MDFFALRSLVCIVFVSVLPSMTNGQTNIHSIKMDADAIEVGGEFESGMFTFRSHGDGTGEMMVLPSLTAHSSLLNNANVLKELEFIDEQRTKLSRIQTEFTNQMNSVTLLRLDHASITQVGMNNLAHALDQIETKRQSQISSLLLPHQKKRLNQISFQQTVRERGEGAALVDKTIADELGIDENQRKRIEKKAKEIDKRIAEKIAQLRAEGRKELLEELTGDQQRRLEQLAGETFEIKNSEALLKKVRKFSSSRK